MSRFTSKFEYLLSSGTRQQIEDELYHFTEARAEGYVPTYGEQRLFDKLELKLIQEEYPS